MAGFHNVINVITETDVRGILQSGQDPVGVPASVGGGNGGDLSLPRSVVGILMATGSALEFHEITFRRPGMSAGDPKSRPGAVLGGNSELPTEVPNWELRADRDGLFEIKGA